MCRYLLCFLFIVLYVSAYEYGHFVEEGALCKKRTGVEGKCTHFSYCQSAIEEVRSNGRPEVCSFAGIFPIVCCPEGAAEHPDGKHDHDSHTKHPHEDHTEPQHATTPHYKETTYPFYIPFDENNVILRKCREYHPKPVRDPQVFYGGRLSTISRYPHMALLGFDDNKNKIRWKCAGSLISEDFVLTTADCIQKGIGELKHIRLGELDIKSTTDDAEPQPFAVKKIYKHPYFRDEHYDNIALVQLEHAAKFTHYVRPACLPVTHNLTGTFPESVGWGLNNIGLPKSQILEVEYMKYVTNYDCGKIYGKSKYLHQGIDEHQHICADGNHTKRQVCQNDPGSPLQITNFLYEFNVFPEIVGLTSFSNGCGNSPDVFTKVHPYISWIQKTVWPHL